MFTTIQQVLFRQVFYYTSVNFHLFSNQKSFHLSLYGMDESFFCFY